MTKLHGSNYNGVTKETKTLKEVKSMKGSRELLTNYLSAKYESNMRNKKELRSVIDYMVNEGFPVLEVTDVVQMRKQLADCSDRMLYYFLKGTNSKLVDEYFSNKEIKEYETTKYKPIKFSFPIKWDMIEITEGVQWIGKISVKELMQLRDAQLINYNERTQRTLKHVVNKDFEYYQIYLNRNAVDAITNSYLNGLYIPNTITLNIPESAEFNYSNGVLTIKDADHLDILDGYHRYVAMSNIFNQNSKFDYTMELRVVCFSEETARQFIWQEDQKTKMRKLDSESLNQNSPANQIINLISQNGMFRNVIGRNDGAIDQGLAANLIDRIWFNKPGNVSRKRLLEVRDEIIARFNVLLSEDPEIFDRKWDYEFTVVAFVLMSLEDCPDMMLLDMIKKQTEGMCSSNTTRIMLGKKGQPITTKVITRVIKFYHDHTGKGV